MFNYHAVLKANEDERAAGLRGNAHGCGQDYWLEEMTGHEASQLCGQNEQSVYLY